MGLKGKSRGEDCGIPFMREGLKPGEEEPGKTGGKGELCHTCPEEERCWREALSLIIGDWSLTILQRGNFRCYK
jgi:hypothetical protein